MDTKVALDTLVDIVNDDNDITDEERGTLTEAIGILLDVRHRELSNA